MAAKKKTRKKQTKPKKTASKKTSPKKTPQKKAKTVARKRLSSKKASARKTARKTISLKKAKAPKKVVRRKARSVETEAFLPEEREMRVGRQSGDLQGISSIERADSESVDELLEEGNTFEAGAVAGVEEADDSDEKEVRTHEVPEDDVPEEYLDEE